MMYPSQTSLIPVTVALVRFFEHAGAGAWGMKYPYWYLGTTPFKFLIGPVVPYVVSLVHKFLPTLSLFNIIIYFVGLTFILSILGWVVFTYLVSGSKKIAIICGSILVIMPWRYFSAISFEEASVTIAKNLLPFALIAIWLYLPKRILTKAVITVITISFILLINTDILPILLVGLSSLVMARGFKEGKIRFPVKSFKRVLIILAISLLTVTLWYTPAYWLTILTNPSIGGASGLRVILRVFDFARAGAPLLLAVVAVYFSGKIKSRLGIFAATWILTFLFLTIFRFIGDPDFWMDWSSWFTEIEIGLAILVSLRFNKLFAFLVLPFCALFWVYSLIGKPQLISRSIPEGIQSLEEVSKTVGKERMFLSGSTTFWANALYDINQIRGGRDEVSLNKDWYKAAYEFREGKDAARTEDWIIKTGVKFVLVHTSDSGEYYHDFKYLDKWKEVGGVVWQENGDTLYKVP